MSGREIEKNTSAKSYKNDIDNINFNLVYKFIIHSFAAFCIQFLPIPASNIPAALSCSKALKLDNVAKTKATVVWSAKAVDLIRM